MSSLVQQSGLIALVAAILATVALVVVLVTVIGIVLELRRTTSSIVG